MPKKKTLEALREELQNKKEIVANMKTIKREADFLYKMEMFFRVGDPEADAIRQKKLELDISNLEQVIVQREITDKADVAPSTHFSIPIIGRKAKNNAKLAEIRGKYDVVETKHATP